MVIRFTSPPHDWQIRQSIAHAAEKASGLTVEAKLVRSRPGKLLATAAQAIAGGSLAWIFRSDHGVLGEFMVRAVEYEIKPISGKATDLLADQQPLDGRAWKLRPECVPHVCAAVVKIGEMLADYVAPALEFEARTSDRSVKKNVAVSLDSLTSEIRSGWISRDTRYSVTI